MLLLYLCVYSCIFFDEAFIVSFFFFCTDGFGAFNLVVQLTVTIQCLKATFSSSGPDVFNRTSTTDTDPSLPRDWLARYLRLYILPPRRPVTDGPFCLLSRPYLSRSLAMKEANWLLNQWQIKSGLKCPVCVCFGEAERRNIRVANLVGAAARGYGASEADAV